MKTSLTFLLLIVFTSLRSQDIHFSLYEQTPQLVNPAHTGFFDGYERAVLVNKKQWSVMGQPYKTSHASFDMPLFKPSRGEKAHIGIGGFVFSDKAGDASFQDIKSALSLSSILPISQNQKMGIGLQVGMGQLTSDLQNIRWGNQYDGTGYNSQMNSMENLNVEKSTYMDISTGIMYTFQSISNQFRGNQHKTLQLGIAIYHLNTPSISYTGIKQEELAQKLVFHGSGYYSIAGSSLSLKPQLYINIQNQQMETLLGTYAIYRINQGSKYTGFINGEAIHIGLHYRVNDALIPSINYEYSHFQIGCSYDVNISTFKVSSKSRGGFEISLKYIGKKGPTSKVRNNRRT